VRLRVPDEGETVFHDAIRGDIATPNSAIDDFVIRRSDGSPLYNLAATVDDRDMGITQVIRGEDHISNTPRQVMILRGLGEEPPTYAHLPLLHGPDGKKLSKRHGAASVQELRDAGYLPEAVRNYIALLGWGYDESTTFFTTDELIERFDLSRVSRNPAVFDEQKLRWMNGRYLRELDAEQLRGRLEQLTGRDLPPEAVAISQEKMQTLTDFWDLSAFLVERQDYDEKAWDKVMRDGAAERLRAAREALEGAEPFDVEHVEQALRGVVERLDAKPREVFQPVRVAIAGTTVSPGIFESVAALGRDETLARIDSALERASGS
jgi:glutamyl-tRNA synthetase